MTDVILIRLFGLADPSLLKKLMTCCTPLLTIWLTCVNLAEWEDLVQHIQNDISSMLLYEHVALSKVQHWVQPEKNLFDTLFLVLFKDEYQDTVWDLVQSTQP